uniref:Uncharacterized protein n=1 Tax=Cacopsylla melanoneura TaxID=428564 RepID=A0A8D8QAZ4_9HEMI
MRSCSGVLYTVRVLLTPDSVTYTALGRSSGCNITVGTISTISFFTLTGVRSLMIDTVGVIGTHGRVVQTLINISTSESNSSIIQIVLLIARITVASSVVRRIRAGAVRRVAGLRISLTWRNGRRLGNRVLCTLMSVANETRSTLTRIRSDLIETDSILMTSTGAFITLVDIKATKIFLSSVFRVELLESSVTNTRWSVVFNNTRTVGNTEEIRTGVLVQIQAENLIGRGYPQNSLSGLIHNQILCQLHPGTGNVLYLSITTLIVLNGLNHTNCHFWWVVSGQLERVRRLGLE